MLYTKFFQIYAYIQNTVASLHPANNLLESRYVFNSEEKKRSKILLNK